MSRCLPENILVPSLAQSQVVTSVPSIRTIRSADASAGSGTCPARIFSTTGSRVFHRLETVAWLTPNNSAATSWTGFCRSRNSTSTTDLYSPSDHIRPGTTGGSGSPTSTRCTRATSPSS